MEGETKVDATIQKLIASEKRITSIAVEALVKNMTGDMRSPEVAVRDVNLKEYDALLCTYAKAVVSHA